ncbi:type I-E CRISPR-associated protein Cas5/CasD [Streptomyces sp. NPDC050704]|uniref:type I-E CRISPR-associated protein Cas5/CasD n=1 Tax=Streptomyces sp. NPDC050704 TaxID=3157219 RepID=UPI003424E61F
MPTVLLRLSAPMQSYGTTSRWEERATNSRPTKSAITGIVANALGLDREDDLADLAELAFAVRADRPGRLLSDHQTAGGGSFPATPLTMADPLFRGTPRWYGAPRSPAPDADGTLRASYKETDRMTVLMTKHFITDGAFLAGLTTPHQHLATKITAALQRPHRLLYLGRKSCPPAHPIAYGITPHGLDWPDHIALLPEATCPTPKVWSEAPPETGTLPSPEQVPTNFAARDHPLMHLRTRHTTPPPAAPENTP